MNRRAGIDTDPGDVPARSRQALGDSLRNRVARKGDDRKLCIRFFEYPRAGSNNVDDIRIAADHVSRQRHGAGPVLLAAICFDREVLSLKMAKAAKLLE